MGLMFLRVGEDFWIPIGAHGVQDSINALLLYSGHHPFPGVRQYDKSASPKQGMLRVTKFHRPVYQRSFHLASGSSAGLKTKDLWVFNADSTGVESL